MVARPPVRLRIGPMTFDDLPEVHRIERASFSVPWPDEAYRSELLANRLASYLVVRADGVDGIIAYGGIWLMVDEAHITTFAVDPAWRRQGVGETLLLALLDLALARHAREATLEVRLSNLAGPPPVREVRLPAGGPPAALLLRQRRGRPDHDDRAAHRRRDAPPDRRAPGRPGRGAAAVRPGRDARRAAR